MEVKPMEISLLLAQVIGVFLMLTSLSMLVDRRNINLLFEAYRNPAVVYITGIFETMLGLVLILKHNTWAADFRVVITLVGWLLLARGLGRTFFPTRTPRALERFRTMQAIFVPLLLFIFLLGGYLAYRGFGY
jgi:hypothetical protein